MTLTSVAAASVNFLANFHRKETKHDERLSTTSTTATTDCRQFFRMQLKVKPERENAQKK